MPQFGLGVFRTLPETTAQVVTIAVYEGYRAGRHGFDVSRLRRKLTRD
jgi:hypothetical protein